MFFTAIIQGVAAPIKIWMLLMESAYTPKKTCQNSGAANNALRNKATQRGVRCGTKLYYWF